MNNLKSQVKRARKLLLYPITLYPLLQTVPANLRVPAWRLIAVKKSHGFAYIRISKAANSTISKTLAAYSFPDFEGFSDDRTGAVSKALFERPGLSVFSKQGLLDRYFVFSFFRNPYTRTLSAFLDKIEMDKFAWVRHSAGAPLGQPMLFSEFVDWLGKGNVDSDKHWAPQTTLCLVPPGELHFVGFVEDLDAGLDFLRAKFFPDAPQGRISVREHNRQNSIQKLKLYYTPEIQRRVYEIYRQDFELLGYSKDLDRAACVPDYPNVPPDKDRI